MVFMLAERTVVFIGWQVEPLYFARILECACWYELEVLSNMFLLKALELLPPDFMFPPDVYSERLCGTL
jgi:hypothetical protein